MKRIANIILLFLIVASAFGQKLKYKNVFEIIQSGNDVLAYNTLLEYQQQDPYFPNTYFQLGNISYKWAMEADPLLEIERVEYFIYNTKLYYGLAKKHISENKSDVRRNRKYYQNVPQLAKLDKLSQQDVLEFIDERLKQIETYDKQVHKIYSYFYRMVNNYNQTVEYYRGILQRFTKLKDIYLAPYQGLVKPMLDTLQNLYDSTLFLYQQYHTAITSYPIKQYHQQLKQKDIVTYRLEGITNTDFLADTIYVWNYRKWNQQVRTVINNDIAKLRSHILITYNRMKKFENELLKGPYRKVPVYFKLEPKVIYEIEKFDYKSLMSAFFQYYKAKLDFLSFSKTLFNDTTDYSLRLVQRARSYKLLNERKLSLDSLLDLVELRNKPQNVFKYQDFISQHFPQGFGAYLTQQRKVNQQYLERQLERYKYFIFRDGLNYAFVRDSVSYRNYWIPTYVQYLPPEQVTAGRVVTLTKFRQGTEVYLGGYIAQSNRSTGFVAKVIGGKVAWFKTFASGAGRYSYVRELGLSPEGIVVILRTERNEKAENKLIKLDFSGRQQKSFVFTSDAMPQFVLYDDINNVILAAFIGRSIEPLTKQDAQLTVEQWDLSGKIQWNANFFVNGSFVDMFRVDTVYHLYVNNNSVVEEYRVSFSGRVLDKRQLISNPGFLAIKAIKLSNRQVNLLGLEGIKGSLYNLQWRNVPKLRYFLFELR